MSRHIDGVLEVLRDPALQVGLLKSIRWPERYVLLERFVTALSVRFRLVRSSQHRRETMRIRKAYLQSLPVPVDTSLEDSSS